MREVGFACGSVVKNPAASAGVTSLVPDLGISTCLEQRSSSHNYWATHPEASTLQLEKPRNEETVHHEWRPDPLAAPREKPVQHEDPAQSNKWIQLKKKRSGRQVHPPRGFPGGSDGKESAWNVGDLRSEGKAGAWSLSGQPSQLEGDYKDRTKKHPLQTLNKTKGSESKPFLQPNNYFPAAGVLIRGGVSPSGLQSNLHPHQKLANLISSFALTLNLIKCNSVVSSATRQNQWCYIYLGIWYRLSMQ